MWTMDKCINCVLIFQMFRPMFTIWHLPKKRWKCSKIKPWTIIRRGMSGEWELLTWRKTENMSWRNIIWIRIRMNIPAMQPFIFTGLHKSIWMWRKLIVLWENSRRLWPFWIKVWEVIGRVTALNLLSRMWMQNWRIVTEYGDGWTFCRWKAKRSLKDV